MRAADRTSDPSLSPRLTEMFRSIAEFSVPLAGTTVIFGASGSGATVIVTVAVLLKSPPGPALIPKELVKIGRWNCRNTVFTASDVEFNITKGDQDILNPRGVNCIRPFIGRGIRVWGARTMSSDSFWKYINVRRLFIFVEESIEEGTQWVVFEPNDEKLWARVKQTITAFLTTVWRAGALMGTTPEEAFFVKCNRSTMTQDDIDNGRLICVIGIAPVKPAEFVTFRIAQWLGGSSVAEL